jgi:hypothetical protein
VPARRVDDEPLERGRIVGIAGHRDPASGQAALTVRAARDESLEALGAAIVEPVVVVRGIDG